MRALLDTGAAVTVVSKTFAKYCKLLQTGETEIRALGSVQRCGEHAGQLAFLERIFGLVTRFELFLRNSSKNDTMRF